MSSKTSRSTKGRSRNTGRSKTAAGRRRRTGTTVAVVVGIALVALAAIFWLNRPERGGSGAGRYAFQVGTPGPGLTAPPIRLASTDGGTFELSSLRGETVLLYFQEGLTCQPCWDQLVDIQKHMDQLKAIGIDQIVTITTDPIDELQQKAADEGLTTPVLSDPDIAVSGDYHANSYGMMGTSRDGHSFVLVGPKGTIEWRADYGGPPNFTMYVPVGALIADIEAGRQRGA